MLSGFAQRSLRRNFFKIRCFEPLLMTCRAPQEAVQGSDPCMKWICSVTEPNHRTTHLWVSLPQHSSLERPCCRWVCSSPHWTVTSAFSSLKCIHKTDSSFTKILHFYKLLWHLVLWQERQWKLFYMHFWFMWYSKREEGGKKIQGYIA